MRKSHPRPLAQLGAGVLVFLVFQLLGAPRAAWAGCGHWEGAASQPFGDLFRLDAIFTAGATGGVHDDLAGLPGRSPARRSPCSGMSCSSRESLPISTTAPGVDGPHQWVASLFALVDLPTNPPSRRTIHEPALTSDGEKTSVFHPPRA